MNQERREKAIAWIKEEIRSLERAPDLNGCPMTTEWAAQLEIMRTCLEAVQDNFPDTSKMVPLTLEQLRQMDGHPVWVRVSENWRESGIYEGWMLIRFHGKDDRVRAYTYDTRFGATFHAQQDYGISWWAYACTPAHIDREVWTAEWVPMTDNDGCTWFECSACEFDLDSLDEKPKFCPKCGKAMTLEAWAELEKRLRG